MDVRSTKEELVNMHNVRIVIALAVSVLLPLQVSVQPVVGTNRRSGTPPLAASAVSQQTDVDAQLAASGAMPNNPSQALPTTVNASIPNSAKVISDDLALLNNGTVKNLVTGRTVTDRNIVGTPSTPPDPLAKTDGKSFIPVSVKTVRSAIRRVSGTQHIRNISMEPNNYGAHWGRYNDSPAFFGGTGDLFVQQAEGVIDVSEHQGVVDWNQVKASGVQGAIIRIAFGWGNRYDSQALNNIAECKRLRIPFGIYLYSYAYDSVTAAEEGTDVVSKLRSVGVSPHDLSYPVFYDLEDWSWTGHVHPTSPSIYEGMVDAWYGKLQAAGYTNLSVYSYMDYLQNELNSTSIYAKTRWVARYGEEMHFTFPTNYRGWQYYDQGHVAGINGTVDLSAFGNQSYQAVADATAYTALSIPNGVYYINSFAKDSSGVDIPGGSAASGISPQLYQANGSAAQQFRFTRQSNGSYTIINVNSGRALDVAGGAAGNLAEVRQWDVNGSAAQQWSLRDSGAGYYLQSALGNWVLDLAWGSVSNGVSVRLYAPNGTSTQKFITSSATSAIVQNIPVSIVSALNPTFALDLPGDSATSGARLQLYSWNGTNAQLYVFQQVGNGVYQVLNQSTGKVIEVQSAATANGGVIQQWDSNNTVAQHWSVMSYGGSNTLVNDASGKVMDVPGANAMSGVRLQSYAFNGSDAQRWVVIDQFDRARLNGLAAAHRNDLSDGAVSLGTSLSPSMVLDVAGGSLSDGAQVRMWSSNGTRAQQWKISHDSQGYVTFTNIGSGKSLDVLHANAENGTLIDQYTNNDTYAQKWIAVRASDGTFVLYSALKWSMVLDVRGASTALGSTVQLYSANSTGAQRWNIK